MNQNQEENKLKTEADIFPFNIRPQNSSSVNTELGKSSDETKPKVKFDPNDFFYDMTGDKHLVIFNHYEYDEGSRSYYNKPPSKRKGTEEDVKALEETFGKLGFLIQTYHDKDCETVWNTFLELINTDFSTASCLCIVILTHGSYKNELYAYDKPFYLDDVTRLFESHPTLAGKPKLFFVQACRGELMDDGNRIETDGPEENAFVMPSHADFLVVRSTVEDYMSYRDSRGSWLIQELCKAIKNYSETLDILHILTMVQQKVAYGYKTNTKAIAARNKLQMPETTFTLTKILKLKSIVD